MGARGLKWSQEAIKKVGPMQPFHICASVLRAALL